MFEKTRVYRAKGKGKCSVDGCDDKYYGNGFCKKHHQWHWKRGLLPKPVEVSIREKILSNIDKDPKTGCWNWKGWTNNNGYGVLSLKGQVSEYVHRASYTEFVGNIPDGFSVCHSCDNPQCCNPEHLWTGSHKQNMADSREKGRSSPPPIRIGTDHARSVLTGEQVKMIRESKKPATIIAKGIGCNPETVRRVRRGLTYANVQ